MKNKKKLYIQNYTIKYILCFSHVISDPSNFQRKLFMIFKKIDYSKNYDFDNWAIFCHAISEMYAKFIYKLETDNDYLDKHKEYFSEYFDAKDLNFFNPKSKLMYLPWGLYSAGQAADSSSPDMITQRNRKNVKFIVGDSGGYQIETGVIKWEGDKTREKMLRWLENNTEISMILDVPTGSIKKKFGKYHEEKDTDFENGKKKIDFFFCLERTCENNDYFIEKRIPGKTKFLNVLQGRYHNFDLDDDETDSLNFENLSWEERKKLFREGKISETDAWYKAVKKYSDRNLYKEKSFEGWALAGVHKIDFAMLLRRLVYLIFDDMLYDKPWIHILGMGKIPIICLYSVILRTIKNNRSIGIPNLTISCDASSGFSSAGGYALVYKEIKMDKKGWSLSFDKIPVDEKYKNSKSPVVTKTGVVLNEVFESSIYNLFTMGDIYNIGKSSINYVYMMHHNTMVLQKAIVEGQKIFERKDIADYLPIEYLNIKKAIEDVLSCDTRNQMIKEIKKNLTFLQKLKDSSSKISEIENDELFHIDLIPIRKKSKNTIKSVNNRIDNSENLNSFFNF